MGVTLERVQNKFACIIGELSHDPDILSQFAIWVDLRIAEYKAKGAISLECTGDDPNPTWLRGHKKSFLKGKLPRMAVRCQTEQLNRPEPFNEQFTQEAEERLSPNIVVVKNEPGTDIFPVNVHANSSTVNAVSSSRKRPSSSSYSPEDSDHTSQLPLKLGKHSSSPAVLEPMNQSLMSIISKCESLDESGEMSDSTANPAQDSASVAGMGDNSMCMPSASTGSTENPDNSSPVKFRISEVRSMSGKRDPKLKQRKCKGYKTYNKATLEEALKAVQEGKLSQRRASKVFNIPQQTIWSHVRKIKIKLNEAMKIKDSSTQTLTP